MATQLLPTATTAASSPDLTVAAGESVTVALKGADGAAKVDVELKDDGGDYQPIGSMDGSRQDSRVIVINAPGTYRFTRKAGAACGVFRA